MNTIIDPPSPFAPLAEWESYLADIETIKPRTFEVRALIAEAKREIAARKA